MKHAPNLHYLSKPITDSVFLYKMFTNKPYASTNFKIIITEDQLLNSHYFTFNPKCEKRNLSLSAGIRFQVSIFI